MGRAKANAEEMAGLSVVIDLDAGPHGFRPRDQEITTRRPDPVYCLIWYLPCGKNGFYIF